MGSRRGPNRPLSRLESPDQGGGRRSRRRASSYDSTLRSLRHMTEAKKRMLPKGFEDLLKKGDPNAIKSVFETCDVDARGGYAKQTALAFNEFPDDLARWLVEQGADI